MRKLQKRGKFMLSRTWRAPGETSAWREKATESKVVQQVNSCGTFFHHTGNLMVLVIAITIMAIMTAV